MTHAATFPGLPPAHRRRLRHQVWGKTQGKCWYCGQDIAYDAITMDHVRPRTEGGTDALRNLVPACPSCNSLKGNGTVEAFRTRLEQWLRCQPVRLSVQHWLPLAPSGKVTFYGEWLAVRRFRR